MNLREGTRRLALLLGVVGAILGGFASYLELQTVLNQRSQHNKFEQLTASDVVTHERKCRLAGIYSGCRDLPTDFVVTPIHAIPPPPSGTIVRQHSAQPQAWNAQGNPIDPITGEQIKIDPQTGERILFDMSTSIPIPSIVMKDGIRAIKWNHNYGVESIEMEDSQTLYSTPSPAAWTYLLVALFPVLGFLIPWGTIRAIEWVVAGFVQPSK